VGGITRNDPPVAIQRLEPHAIRRERPGLVRADVGDRPERFHRRKAPDEGVAPRHAPRADGQRYRDDRRQRFGQDGDREADGREQHAARLLSGQEADAEYQGAQGEDGDGQPLAQPGETPL
jgi:hypothetical protein